MNELKDKNFPKELNTILKNGGVIAFVTDTVWGVGCLPNNENGVKKIYELKHRDTSKPLILMSNNVENLRPYVQNVSNRALKIAEKHFPGALTLIFERSEKTPKTITSGLDTVGVRVPDNKTFQKICSMIDGNVLATTSANLSGETPAMTYEEAVEKVGRLVDLVIEAEDEQAEGVASTVAMVTDTDTKIFRQGKIKIDEE